MFIRFAVAALVGTVLSGMSFAGTIRFDFGNGNVDTGGTGVAANVVILEGTPLTVSPTATIGGTTITLQGVGPSGRVWGSNQQGIGIIPGDQLGMAGARRIDGTQSEFVHFSFDKDAVIDSIRLGAMGTATNTTEEVEIAFVSGDDPFAGGSFTLTGINPEPTDDIPVGVFVTAGTVLSLTATVPVQSGVLWNDIVVSVIPEPATIAMVGLAAAAFAVTLRRRES